MKKQLVIIGCYLDTEIKKEVLRRNLNTLKEHFDVLIASHHPVDKEFQELAKYTVYDSNNGVHVGHGYITWHDFGTIYHQRHLSGSRNASYAVYQLIRGPLPFVKSLGYDSFFYLEGDMLVAKEDCLKILNLKTETIAENKSACFFKSYDKPFWDCQLFYSEIDFFLSSTPVILNFDEFVQNCEKISTPVIDIESFLFKTLYVSHTNKVRMIDYHVEKYMEQSSLNITRADTEYNDTITNFEIGYHDTVNDVFVHYAISIMKMIETNRIFLTYRRIGRFFTPDVNVYINGILIMSVTNPGHALQYCEWLGQDDILEIKVVDNNKVVKQFTVERQTIVDHPDFIRFQ